MTPEARERVLVVDDEPQMLVALEDVLADDFTVFKTTSPQAALETMQQEQDIAVVVSDQRMPFMEGDELLSRCRQASDAARILLTGFADLSAVIRAVNQGKIFAYVSKPWNAEDLKVKVKQAAEHYRLERELTRQRQLLQSIVDQMAEGVVVIDADDRMLLCNPEARKIFGMPESSAPLGTWAQRCGLFMQDQQTPVPRESNPLACALRGQRTASEEFFVRNHQPKGRTVVMAATPLHDESGAIKGAVSLVRDVTAERRLEQQLMHSQKMEAIGRLAGGIAHDFNNIIAVILSYASLLERTFSETGQSLSDVRQIVSASRRAAALTNQLLSFGRRRAGQCEPIDLNCVIAGVNGMLRRVLREDIELQTFLSPVLRAVRVDASQIEQVLLNLAVNASDAMANPGCLSIETHNVKFREGTLGIVPRLAPGDYVLLSVSDTGAGIDGETQKHIFEPFFTTKDVDKGTGLGLSTVYGIVQRSGGDIVVESRPGLGTSFKIYLPSHAEEPTRTATPAGMLARARSTARILVVEDDPSVRAVTVRILEENGYDVVEASNAEEAIDRCDAQTAMVLADVVMPKKSGTDLAAELTEQYPSLRLVFMSGYAGEELSRHRVAFDTHLHLDKPFSPSELLRTVALALGKG